MTTTTEIIATLRSWDAQCETVAPNAGHLLEAYAKILNGQVENPAESARQAILLTAQLNLHRLGMQDRRARVLTSVAGSAIAMALRLNEPAGDEWVELLDILVGDAMAAVEDMRIAQ